MSPRIGQHRIDGNHRVIESGLKAVGCSVHRLYDRSDGGLPDLLVGRGGCNYLLEIKRPGEKLNDCQQAWRGRWRGELPLVVHSLDEALSVLGLGQRQNAKDRPVRPPVFDEASGSS